MLLGGALIKGHFGKQGTLSILEGSSSNRLFLPETYSIAIEKRQSSISDTVPIPRNIFGKIKTDLPLTSPQFPELSIALLDWVPHSQERFQLWIKDGLAFINGLPPIPLQHSKTDFKRVSYPLPFDPSARWNIFAVKTDDVNAVLREIYANQAVLRIYFPNSVEVIPFKEAKNTLNASLQFNDSSFAGFQEPSLELTFNTFQVKIPLDGPSALLNEMLGKNFLNPHAVKVDIEMPPTLLLAQDNDGVDYLFYLSPSGEIHGEVFQSDRIHSLFVFDDGYKGYGIKASIPLHAMTPSRKALEAAIVHRQSLLLNEASAPPFPIGALQQASEKIHSHFPEFWLAFLKEWELCEHWLYPTERTLPLQVEKVVEAVNSAPFHSNIVNGALWAGQFFRLLESDWDFTQSLYSHLEKTGWPLLSEFPRDERDNTDKILRILTGQLFALGEYLPPPKAKSFAQMSPSERAQVITAILRLQGFDPHLRESLEDSQEKMEMLAEYLHMKRFRLEVEHILGTKGFAETLSKLDHLPENSSEAAEAHRALLRLAENIIIDQNSSLSTQFKRYAPLDATLSIDDHSFSSPWVSKELFTPVSRKITALPSLQKWEDNIPLITVKISLGDESETVQLSYDSAGSGLKWPVLNGKYLLRFQPQFEKIPFEVRLRDARQINYPNTLQPYSFESDLVFNNEVEKTISMNHVHETPEGYRFYMAGLSPSSEVAVQRAQIAVNYDPAKYFLTYPGAIILTIGILLLFWFKKVVT